MRGHNFDFWWSKVLKVPMNTIKGWGHRTRAKAEEWKASVRDFVPRDSERLRVAMLVTACTAAHFYWLLSM